MAHDAIIQYGHNNWMCNVEWLDAAALNILRLDLILSPHIFRGW